MNLAKSLKKALLEKGMSQLALAASLGMTSVHVNRLANGKSQMSPDVLERISETLGMKVSEFVALGES